MSFHVTGTSVSPINNRIFSSASFWSAAGVSVSVAVMPVSGIVSASADDISVVSAVSVVSSVSAVSRAAGAI